MSERKRAKHRRGEVRLDEKDPHSPSAQLSDSVKLPPPPSSSSAESESDSVLALRARINALSAQNARLSSLLSVQSRGLRQVAQRGRDVRSAIEAQLDELVQAAQDACDDAENDARDDKDDENGEGSGQESSSPSSSSADASRLRARRESEVDGNGRLSAHEASGGRVPSGMSIKAKEFTPRDSRLTHMFRTSDDIRTVYSMFVSVLILFGLKVFINDLFTVHDTSSTSQLSLWLLFWNFGGVGRVVLAWMAMAAAHAAMLPLMWGWRRGVYGDVVYGALYAMLQTAFLFGFGRLIWILDLPIASSLILLCEQVRMLMKAHSFWRETLRMKHPDVPASEAEPKSAIPHASNSVANTTLASSFEEQAWRFVYFFFVPTLIYRNVYPRTRRIRWSWIGRCFAEVIGCTFYIYVLFATFCVPEFQATASHPGDFKAFFASLFNSVLPGIATYLLAFFGLLHSWMNLFAELTRFADRLFYTDWWNTKSFSAYYRKWNIIVHDSLYQYLYVDLVRLGVSKGWCFFLTFLVSAVVHEYIISMCLRFFYPVLLVMFLGFGVFFVYLTKLCGNQGREWNIFFWTNLIIGNGMLLIFYSREYYARQPWRLGDDPHFRFDSSSWLPYSWQPFFLHR